MRAPHRTRPRIPAGVLLLVVLLMLAGVALQNHTFRDREYHTDEVNTIHGARVLSIPEIAQWMATNAVHPAGWRVFAGTWIKLTGVYEPVVRHFSTLSALLAFALLFRLMADLFDRRAGLWAVFVLATLPFAIFYLKIFRPYPMLMAVMIALLLTFLRWLRRPNGLHALLFVMTGTLALQTHYYGAFVVAALAVTFVVLVRWDRVLYLRAAGVFAAIGLSLTAWALPLINRLFFGLSGVPYSQPTSWATLEKLYGQMRLSPPLVSAVVLIAALLLPVGDRWRAPGDDRLRFGQTWRKFYLLVPLVTITALALLTNLKAHNLTPRNMSVITPLIAALAAFALVRVPRLVALPLAVVIAVFTLSTPRYFMTAGPYSDTVAFMQDYRPGEPVVFFQNTPTISIKYYLQDRLPGVRNDRLLHVGYPSIVQNADPFRYRVNADTAAERATFAEFLGDAPRVWEVRRTIWNFADPFLEILHADYALHRYAWLIEDHANWFMYQYTRIPDGLEARYHFTDPQTEHTISAQAVNVYPGMSAPPCATVTVETWWQAHDDLTQEYAFGVVMVDPGGQEIVTLDAPPTSAPTAAWRAGRVFVDSRALTVPCETPPGDYALLVGVHRADTGEPLDVALPDGAPAGSPVVYLTTLTVTG